MFCKHGFVMRYFYSCALCSLFFAGLFLFSSCSDSSGHKGFVYVGFDESVGAERIGKKYFQSHELDQKRYELCSHLWGKEATKSYPFNTKNPAENVVSKIPKIIHQVWLKEAALPKHFKRYRTSWKDKHPDWQYRLWTQESLSELPQDIQELIKIADNSYEKEDLVRAAVLYKFGGLFVDFEFECLKAVDDFHAHYDFYTVLEPPLLQPHFDRVLQIGTGLVGAIPTHPIIKKWQEEMRLRLQRKSLAFVTVKEKNLWATYASFGDVVEEVIARDPLNCVVLPPTYAYPISPRWIYSFHKTEHKKKKRPSKSVAQKILAKQERPLFSMIEPESFAINHAGGTWGKRKMQPDEPRQIGVREGLSENRKIPPEVTESKNVLSTNG